MRKALDDDLNTAQALGVLFELVREANTAIDGGAFLQGNVSGVLGCVDEWNRIFDVLSSSEEGNTGKSAGEVGISTAEIDRKIEERQEARRKRDFARADRLRDELIGAGILIEDTKDGVRWRRK